MCHKRNHDYYYVVLISEEERSPLDVKETRKERSRIKRLGWENPSLIYSLLFLLIEKLREADVVVRKMSPSFHNEVISSCTVAEIWWPRFVMSCSNSRKVTDIWRPKSSSTSEVDKKSWCSFCWQEVDIRHGLLSNTCSLLWKAFNFWLTSSMAAVFLITKPQEIVVKFNQTQQW